MRYKDFFLVKVFSRRLKKLDFFLVKVFSRRLKKLIVFLSLAFLLILISNISLARDVSIDLRLAQQKVNVGDEFTVELRIDQVSDLKGINILISFDNPKLDYRRIDKGALINDFSEDILPNPKEANETGKIEYMAVRKTPGLGVDSTGGIILTLTFIARSPGEAWIKLEPNDVSLGDSVANAIPANIVTDRYVVQIGEVFNVKIFNYPNPAPDSDGNTVIRCESKAFLEGLEVRVYDISGELVKTIKYEEFDVTRAPVYEYTWDCQNESKQDVANGTYILWSRASFKDSEDKFDTWKIAILR